MKKMKFDLWIEAEEWEKGFDKENDNSDIIVTFEDNSRWVTSLFTCSNIQKLREKKSKHWRKLIWKIFLGK